MRLPRWDEFIANRLGWCVMIHTKIIDSGSSSPCSRVGNYWVFSTLGGDYNCPYWLYKSVKPCILFQSAIFLMKHSNAIRIITSFWPMHVLYCKWQCLRMTKDDLVHVNPIFWVKLSHKADQVKSASIHKEYLRHSHIK